MSGNNEQISSKSLMFSIACFVLCSATLIGYVTHLSKNDTWLCAIAGLIIALPIVFIFVNLAEKFPSKDIIEINDIVFGKIAGRFLSFLYVFYFFTLTFLNSVTMENFVESTLVPETPKVAIYLLFIIPCAYAVRKGIQNFSRLSTFILIVILLLVFINTLLLTDTVKITNILPILGMPMKKYIQPIHEIAILPFSDIIIFMMLFPNIKSTVKIRKPVFFGLLIGAAAVVLIVLRDIMVLGPIIDKFGISGYESVRLIHFGDIFQRMELIYATALLTLYFFKITILYYVTVKSVSRIFGLKSYRLFVPIFIAMITLFAITSSRSDMENAGFASKIAPFYQTIMQFLLPLITLVIASMRGLGVKSQQSSQNKTNEGGEQIQ